MSKTTERRLRLDHIRDAKVDLGASLYEEAMMWLRRTPDEVRREVDVRAILADVVEELEKHTSS